MVCLGLEPGAAWMEGAVVDVIKLFRGNIDFRLN